jgi:uncharacterized delta-60 repeat protein
MVRVRRSGLAALASLSAAVVSAGCGWLAGLGDERLPFEVVVDGGDAFIDAASPDVDAPRDARPDIAPDVDVDITATAGQVNVVRGRTAPFGVAVVRRHGHDSLPITVSGLPRGVTADPLTIAGGQSSGVLTLRAAGDAELGPTHLSLSTPGGHGSGSSTLLVQDPPGTLDVTFGKAGAARVKFNDTLFAVAGGGFVLAPDGSLLLCGNAATAGGVAIALARLTADGSVDLSFGAQGTLLANGPGALSDVCEGLAVLPSGRILVGGFESGPSGAHYFMAAAFTQTGSVDPTFGTDGFFAMDVGAGGGPDVDSKAYALALQSDGKLLLAGFGGTQGAMIRLTPDGQIDSSFANGAALGPSGLAFVGLGLRSDGRIFGSFNAMSLTVRRYSSLGAVDGTYGVAGLGKGPAGQQLGDRSGQLVVQPDDKVVLSGTRSGVSGAGDSIELARYADDGTLDSSFGEGGIVTTSIVSGYAQAHALALGPSGQIAVAASISSPSSATSFGVARYTALGKLDTTFGGPGYVTTIVGEGAVAQAVAFDAYGRIIVAGKAPEAASPQTTEAVVVRFWP